MRIDVFCDIVDNYGDAGVCWRLVRRLAETSHQDLLHHSIRESTPDFIHDSIRLFCDDLKLLDQLAGTDAKALGRSLGIEILTWADSTKPEVLGTELPDLVIESFGCALPQAYLEHISLKTSCVILNLEYLSAEDWIDSHHALPSPSGTLKKYFFFPGFSKSSGTLLKGLLPRQDDPLPKSLKLAWSKTRDDALKICLFCYDTPNMKAFIESFKHSGQKIDFLICFGQAQELVRKIEPNFESEMATSEIQWIPLPFVSQDDFDHLLNSCDLNIVRGEDSFVRAQWAAKPFIWQIYPQEDEAHHLKLEAFLKKYLKNSSAETAHDVNEAMRLACAKTWLKNLPSMAKHALNWRNELDELTFDGDLAVQIRKFLKKI